MKDSLGRKQFLLRLPHDLFDSTKSYADKENLSITRYINRAIEAYVEATNEVDEVDKKKLPSEPGTGWWMNLVVDLGGGRRGVCRPTP